MKDCKYESEGYCDKKEKYLNPQECDGCPMHEFTLHSATKYKDGTPIYAEPNGLTIGAVSDVLVQHTAKQKELSNQLDSLEQRVDELSEEYDTVLKTHGDTLEEHLDRICELECMYESIIEDMCAVKQRLCNITSLITEKDKYVHIFDNFCGNCTHCDHDKQGDDTVYACELSGEIIDPDSASCSMFEPPF